MSVTVRAYNVLFGDDILLSWDENDGRHWPACRASRDELVRAR
jgi:hypothetical protein